MQYYTGIGSRATPPGILKMMEEFAHELHDLSFTLRSGHADGADYTFEKGAQGLADIYLPWDEFNSSKIVHGNAILFDTLPSYFDQSCLSQLENALREKLSNQHLYNLLYGKTYIVNLQKCNVLQVLGHQVPAIPSEFVILWAPPLKDMVRGGTNTAMQVALNNNIPVFNLFHIDDEVRLRQHIDTL